MQSGALRAVPCTPPLRSRVVRARSFRWRIDNWPAFQQDAANRTYGAAFSAGGFSWRLLLFPRGNTVPFLSLYLAVTSDFQQRLPSCWVKFARFALIVPNRTAPALVKMTQHQFDRHVHSVSVCKGASFAVLLCEALHTDSLRAGAAERTTGASRSCSSSQTLPTPPKDGSATTVRSPLRFWCCRRYGRCVARVPALLPAACDAHRAQPTKPYVTRSWTGDAVTAVVSHPAL